MSSHDSRLLRRWLEEFHWAITGAKVKELRAAAHSLPAIAREMNLSVTTVARICK